MNRKLLLVGTARCAVPGGKAAGNLRPPGARTAQRAVPTFISCHIPRFQFCILASAFGFQRLAFGLFYSYPHAFTNGSSFSRYGSRYFW
jgi:hypothetical protein